MLHFFGKYKPWRWGVNMKHTKGPWIIIGNNVCYDSDYGGPFKTVAENVKKHNLEIIAAAPEMLEALQNQIVYMENNNLGPVEHLKIIVKKARG